MPPTLNNLLIALGRLIGQITILVFGCRTVYRTSDSNPHGQFLYFIYVGARGWRISGIRDFLRSCRSVWLVRHAPRATTNQQCDLGTSEIGARRISVSLAQELS